MHNRLAWTHHPYTLLFFYCLLIALFVTVCIYTYAGQQQSLPTRNVGGLVINGVQTEVDDLVTDVSDGDTLSFDAKKKKFYLFESGGTVGEITLPVKDDIIALMPVKTNGAITSFGTLVNEQGTAITVNLSTGITDPTGAGGTLAVLGTAELNFIYRDGNLIWYP